MSDGGDRQSSTVEKCSIISYVVVLLEMAHELIIYIIYTDRILSSKCTWAHEIDGQKTGVDAYTYKSFVCNYSTDQLQVRRLTRCIRVRYSFHWHSILFV